MYARTITCCEYNYHSYNWHIYAKLDTIATTRALPLTTEIFVGGVRAIIDAVTAKLLRYTRVVSAHEAVRSAILRHCKRKNNRLKFQILRYPCKYYTIPPCVAHVACDRLLYSQQFSSSSALKQSPMESQRHSCGMQPPPRHGTSPTAHASTQHDVIF